MKILLKNSSTGEIVELSATTLDADQMQSLLDEIGDVGLDRDESGVPLADEDFINYLVDNMSSLDAAHARYADLWERLGDSLDDGYRVTTMGSVTTWAVTINTLCDRWESK